MANRYWVGGTGNWSDTNHWSATSGGSGGASVPTSNDDVFFDANSFTAAGQSVTLNITANCRFFNWANATNNPTLAGSSSINIYGGLSYTANMTDISTGTKIMNNFDIGSAQGINTNGVTLNGNMEIVKNRILSEDIIFNESNGIIINGGYLNANNYNITCGVFGVGKGGGTVTLGSSIVTCSGNFAAPTTVNAGTSTIKMTGDGTIFNGVGKTFYNVELPSVTVKGSNTFNNLKLAAGKTVKFTEGATQTVTSLTDAGAIIESTVAGSSATLRCTSGTIIKQNGSLKDITATGGATFRAYDTEDISGNTGWTFYATGSAEINCTATVTCTGYILEYAVIETGLTTDKGSFFKFNDNLYYMQPGRYSQYDGTTVSEVVPYIPTVIINRTPSGGGDVLEEYNRIGKGFITKFNGTTSDANYQLPDGDLDDTEVLCTVDGVTKTEGTHFNVNRTTGVVTFNTVQTQGQNNVVITAFKTVQEDIDSVLTCKYAIPFGGQNDNRIFIGGNGSGYFYWTGITDRLDASYFPYNNYNVIGNSDEDITGFRKHHETLCIFKEREIYGETYTFDGTKGIFNTFGIRDNLGCDCPDTLMSINNNVVWLTSYAGPQILVSTERTNQRNAFPIGRNINPGLMQELNLKTATSIDYKGHYWICVNNKAYLWNYFISPYVDTGNPDESARRLSWWYFDNINASSFATDGIDLYYAHNEEGKVVKFVDNFVDFDEGINAVYRLPLRDFGNSVYEFDVLNMWVDVRGDTRSKIKIDYIISDETDFVTEPEEVEIESFSIPGLSIPGFTLDVIGMRQTFVLQPLEKKIDLFGVEFSDNTIGRDMNLSNVVISYVLGKRKR